MKKNAFPRLVVLGLVWALAPLWARGEDKSAGPPQENPLRTFAGEITDIGKIDGTITIRKFPMTRTFQVAKDCAIITTDKPKAALKDLKVGDKVKVKYEEASDGFLARRIVIRGIDAEDREDAREQERLDRQ